MRKFLHIVCAVGSTLFVPLMGLEGFFHLNPKDDWSAVFDFLLGCMLGNWIADPIRIWREVDNA